MTCMADTPYPLLRRKRVVRWTRVFTPMRLRLLAIALLALVVVAGVAVLATRSPRVDARTALADARTTLAAGNYSAARRNAQAAIGAAPAMGIAHAVLARADLALGDGLAAEAELVRARDTGVAADRLHHLQAQARLLQGDPAGAIDAADQAGPRYAADAQRVRAQAMAAQGDTVAARAILRRQVDEQPRDGAGWTALGRLALNAGDVGTAAAAAAQAVALLPREPAALTMQGEVVRLRYGLIAALPWFERALATDAYYHPALIEYAATLGDAGRYAEMLAATRRAQLARPGSPQALYLQAVLAARAGRIELARSLLQKTGGAIDGLPGAILLSGSLDYAEGKFEQASAMWRGLARQQPLNVGVRRLLGAALLRSGDPRAALDMLRPIGARGDADSYALTLLARALGAVAESPDDAAAVAAYLDRAGRAATGASEPFWIDDQIGTLEADVARTPDVPSLMLAAIRGRAQAGDHAGALARARTLVAASPGAPAALLALGDALSVAGRYREAAPVYARAANLRFDEPVMLRLVDALGRAGQAEQAATALALYLSQNPQSVAARRILGRLQLGAGQAAAAIETLEGVRHQLGTRDALLLADLSRAYGAVAAREGEGGGDGGGGDAVALRYARAAYALAPMNAAVVDAYGVALAADVEAGPAARDGARQLLEKAAMLAPGDGVIASHLAGLR